MAKAGDQSTGDNCYRFGDFLLDIDRSLLFCRGEEVELRPQSFDMLQVFVENAGQLISKDKLHETVWGNIAVTDDSITQCVIDIRKALGDTQRSMLRTVPRRGYLFSATILENKSEQNRSLALLFSHKRALIATVFVAIVLAGTWLINRDRQYLDMAGNAPPNAIAVLPFINSGISTETDGNDYLGAAFSDELRDNLGRIPGLRLAARSSSVAITRVSTDAVTMAKQLGVSYIVEGSFQQDGEKLLISLQLIEGHSGLTIWAQTFNRRKAEMISVQQSIAEQIVNHVLPGAGVTASVAATHNPSAHELMLLARHYEREVRDKEEVNVPVLLEAIRLYRKATEIDPESALAHSRLAGALLYFGDVSGAEAPIFQALTLNPNLSEVQDTLGKYYWARGLDSAGPAWEKAFELNPNNADALASYAYWVWMQGYSTGPDKYYRRALDLDPLALSRYGDLGNFLGTQGKVNEVRDLIEQVKLLFDDVAALELISRLHEFLGELDHAIAWTIRARDLEPDNPSHNWRLAELYALIGDDETARSFDSEPGVGLLFFMRRYQELVDSGEMLMIDEPDDIMVRYLLAFGYNATGDFQAAARILRLSGLTHSSNKWLSAIQIEASVTYLNALNELGEISELRELVANWWIRRHVQNTDWWIHTYESCVKAIQGHNEEAIKQLETISGSARLPWYPVIMDSPCFERFANDQRYLGLLREIEARRAGLRSRLPSTLAGYGVTL